MYATCINMVGKWYPERRGARTGFVNGGFAYGSLPFIFIFNYTFDTGNYQEVLDLIGVFVLITIGACGFFFKDWFSDLLGRKQALIVVLIIEALAQFGTLWAGNTHNEALFLIFAFISGFGGGAFYPMFASLVPDYFGENHNATNYGLVYSAKLVSGLFGGGLGAVVIGAWDYTGAYTLAGIMGLISAVMALALRQPGRPKAPKIEPNPYPISREIM